MLRERPLSEEELRLPAVSAAGVEDVVVALPEAKEVCLAFHKSPVHTRERRNNPMTGPAQSCTDKQIC